MTAAHLATELFFVGVGAVALTVLTVSVRRAARAVVADVEHGE